MKIGTDKIKHFAACFAVAVALGTPGVWLWAKSTAIRSLQGIIGAGGIYWLTLSVLLQVAAFAGF